MDSIISGMGTVPLDDEQHDGKKIGKAKAKRAKKAAKQVAEDASYSCAICKEVFPSRTKLFAHLEEADHASPVPKAAKGGKNKKR